jgi:multiple sugar transport system substrate-binding protein
LSEEKVSRRSWVKYAGAGVVVVAAAAGAGYYATLPKPTPTPTPTTPTPTPTTPTPTPTTPAEVKRLTILWHNVHRQVTRGETGAKAGNLLDDFGKKYNVEFDLIEASNVDIWEKYFRELSTGTSSIDIGYMQDRDFGKGKVKFMEPLDKWNKEDPIEDFNDFFKGAIDAHIVDGALYGIPVRVAPTFHHYRKDLFEKYGIKKYPETYEELAEVAKKLTIVKDGKTEVYGYVEGGARSTAFQRMAQHARSFGGDLITPDLKVVIDEEPAIKALKWLVDLKKAGAIPPNYVSIGRDEVVTLVTTGKVAIANEFGPRYVNFIDPKKSVVHDKIGWHTVPPGGELAKKQKVGVTYAGLWAMTIPRNLPEIRKSYAWKFIKFVSSKTGHLIMALNGNGSTRASTYDEERFKKTLPAEYVEVTKTMLEYAKPLNGGLPPFDEVDRAMDIIELEIHNAMEFKKSPEEAFKDAARQLRGLKELH